jgi:hypothetical protein
LCRLHLRLRAGRDPAGNQEKVFAGDRIFVFATEKMLSHEYIEIRGQNAWTGSSLEQADSARVLLTSKNELSFLLALIHLFPDWHRRGHEHGHHAERHEQRRHGVAIFPRRAPRSAVQFSALCPDASLTA